MFLSYGHAYAAIKSAGKSGWPRYKRNLYVVLIGVGSLYTQVGAAAQWSVQPEIYIGGQYDTNPSLLRENYNASAGYSARPRINTEVAGDNYRARLYASLYATTFSDKDVKDRREESIVLDVRHQTTERTKLELYGRYRGDTLFRTIEIDVTDDSEDAALDDVDTSLEVKVKRVRTRVRPRISHKWSQRNTTLLAYTSTSTAYSGDEGTGLTDNEWLRTELSQSHALTNRSNITGIGRYTIFRNDLSEEDTKSYDLSLRYDYGFSAITKGRISIGGRRTTFTENGVEQENPGSIINIGLRYKGEISRHDITLRRDVYQSGTSATVEASQFLLRSRYRITELLAVSAVARHLRTVSIGEESSSRDRNYTDIRVNLIKQMSRNWNISTGYRYRRQKFDNESDAASSNAITLGVSYRTTRISASR